MQLYAMQLFPVQGASGLKFMTLEQMVRSEVDATIDHPLHYLTCTSRMLAHAMLQRLACRHALTEDQWLDAVVDGSLGALADHLFGKGADETGFALYGDAAFMQMPDSIFDYEQAGEPIEGLFQPFRARREGTAKALRSQQPLRGVCDACAAIGIFCTQTLSGPMARYWAAAPTSGAVIYHLQTPSLGQSLLLNVLHGGSIGSRSTCGLPWVPQPEDADAISFERHLLPENHIKHPAEISFPMVRAMRLVRPDEADVGCCDACGRPDQRLVRRFRLKSENELHKHITPKGLAHYAAINNGVALPAPSLLNKTLSPVARHPALAMVTRHVRDDATERQEMRPQSVSGGVENLSNARPGWLHLVEAMRHGCASLPPTLQQYLVSHEAQESINRAICIGMFGVQFEGGNNPNPRFVLETLQGASHLLHSSASTQEVALAASGLTRVVDSCIDAWVEGAQRLEWEVCLGAQGMQLVAPKAAKRRFQMREAALKNVALRGQAHRLWSQALQEVDRIAATISSCTDPHEIEHARAEAAQRLRTNALRGWKRFITSRGSRVAQAKDLYIETQAEHAFVQHLEAPGAAKSRRTPKQSQIKQRS